MTQKKPRAKKIKIIKVEPIKSPLSPVPEGAQDLIPEPVVLGHRVELEVYEAPAPPPAMEPPAEPIDPERIADAEPEAISWLKWLKKLW